MFRIILMLLIILGIGFGTFFADTEGLVTIELLNYRIQMNLMVFFLVWLCSFLSIYLIEYIYKKSFFVFKRIHHSIFNFKAKKAQKNIQIGLIKLKNGELKKGCHIINKYLPYIDDPLIYLIEITETTITQKDFKATEKYLVQIRQLTGENNITYKILTIKLLLAKEEYNKAAQIIEPLYNKYYKNSKIVRLTIEVYEQSQEYHKLGHVLKDARKYNMLTNQEIELLVENLAQLYLNQFINKPLTDEEIDTWFKNSPEVLQNNLPFVINLLEFLLENEKYENADYLISNKFNLFIANAKGFDELLALMAQYPHNYANDIIKKLTKIYASNADNISLNKILAKIFFYNKQYKNAITYFKFLIEHDHIDNLNDYKMALTCFTEIGDQEMVAILKTKV